MESQTVKGDVASEFSKSPLQTATQDPPGPYTTTLLFDQENGVSLSPPKRQEIVITPSLARAFVRAASIQYSKEPPLSFSTLLVAMMVDEGGWLKTHFETQKVRFDVISKKKDYNEASLRELGGDTLVDEYPTSSSARAALEEAERIARLTSGGTTIDMRHLCAAYPILSGWHLQDFAAFEIDRLEWARAFGTEMAQRFPNERAYWRGYADRASPVSLTSFSADVYTEEDLLGIDRSVDALALLIASARTVTPLAIGVFGPWGSGKTFFMRHLQKRIVGIRCSEQARIDAWMAKRNEGIAKPDDAPLYFGEIAQVEFNAWHYNEGNLVASLVEHLFRNLRVLPNEGDERLAKRRADMLRQLKVLTSDVTTIDETIAAAKKNVDEAKAGVDRASQEAEAAKNDVGARARQIEAQIERSKAELLEERSNLDDALQSIKSQANKLDPEAVIAVALGPLGPLAGQMRNTIASARDQMSDWENFIARVFTIKGAVVAMCLLVPFAFWLAHALQPHWTAFTAAILAAFAGFSKAFDVLERARAQFVDKLEKLDAEQKRRAAEARERIEAQRVQLTSRTQADLDTLTEELERQRAALAKREQAVNDTAQELARRAREHDAKLAERVKAENRVRTAEAELERLSSALLLEEFIKDRSSTDEYRKQLGFLALVRRDIERLSKLIDDANKRWLDTGNDDPSPLLNRIVLYIDDLDRCKESTVLAVLEAVHLLLAFPLFVCAVAVDPRWVEKCLREAHTQLFIDDKERKTNGNENASATVGDYLEKIFQIPIWMSPIESRTRATLVNSLLGPTAAPAPRGVRAAQSGATASTASSGAPEASPFNALVAKARETPDPLRISPEEAAFVGDIAALLSDRPRALKRFVNIYRLLKASLPDIERAAFVTAAPSSGYRICLSQLALFTGHPRLAPLLVAGLEKVNGGMDENGGTTRNLQEEEMSLEDWFNTLESVTQSDLRSALKLIPERETLPLGEFRRWLPLTSRYLFHRAD
jgi:hypothetical protein